VGQARSPASCMQRDFVIQLGPDAEACGSQLAGRVEHIAWGPVA